MCEDVIKVELPKAPELVVIDAELSRPQGGGAAQLRVLVTKTTDYYSADIVTVNNASVSLLFDNQVLSANHKEGGEYLIDVPEITIYKEYQLVVDVDGVLYTATEELTLSGTFDRVVQGDGNQWQ